MVTPPDWTELASVLQWIVSGGCVIACGLAASFLAENWPAWKTFPTWVKVWAPVVVAVLGGLGASELLKQKELIEAFSPQFSVIARIIIFWVASQYGLIIAKEKGYGLNKLPKSEEPPI